MSLPHTVSECQSDESGECAIFLHKIGCNVPWDIEKRGPDRSSTPKKISFDVKIAKIGPADPFGALAMTKFPWLAIM